MDNNTESTLSNLLITFLISRYFKTNNHNRKTKTEQTNGTGNNKGVETVFSKI